MATTFLIWQVRERGEERENFRAQVYAINKLMRAQVSPCAHPPSPPASWSILDCHTYPPRGTFTRIRTRSLIQYLCTQEEERFAQFKQRRDDAKGDGDASANVAKGGVGGGGDELGGKHLNDELGGKHLDVTAAVDANSTFATCSAPTSTTGAVAAAAAF